MKIGNFSHYQKMIILAAIVLVGAISVLFISHISAASKKAAPTDSEVDIRARLTNPEQPGDGVKNTVDSNTLEIADTTSKVILRVNGMSCSGCIYTIKSSVSGIDGVQDVWVGVAYGRVDIYYDNRKLKDVNRVADAISASGYPAQVAAVLTSEQIRQERSLAASRALNTIASVGGWDILREDFNAELAHAKKRYIKVYGDDIFNSTKGKALMDNIKAQVVSSLINEGFQVQEIQKAGFVVEDAAVDMAFQKFLNQKGANLEEFKADLEEIGLTFAYFMKKFKMRMLINQYINEHVLNGIIDKFEKQRRYTSWLNNARLLAEVVYYDKELERLTQSQSAGGGCSSGGSCRVKNNPESKIRQ